MKKPSERNIRHRKNPTTLLGSVEKWIQHYSAVHPVSLGFAIFISVSIIVATLSIPFYLEDLWSFWGNVLVEAHGMMFDLLIIGVFVFWLHRIGHKQLIIIRYKEEIEDYLGWQHIEAMLKIIDLIKKLNYWGVSDIYLSGAYLKKGFLREANLKGANLDGSNLIEADLVRANLRGAYLIGADLTKANLTDTNLVGADLRRADLRGANLTGAKLRKAILETAMYDEFTKWPRGFNYKKSGAILYLL